MMDFKIGGRPVGSGHPTYIIAELSANHGQDFNLYQKTSMPWEWQPRLKKIANDLGMDFFSTPFDQSRLVRTRRPLPVAQDRGH